MDKSIIQHLRQYVGKDRKQVRNPCITANEAIVIANYIDELERRAAGKLPPVYHMCECGHRWQSAAMNEPCPRCEPSSGVPDEWVSIVDRIVPDLSPEPDQEHCPAEWSLWADRQRIRRELLTAAPTAQAVLEDQVVAWVSPLRYGSQVTFQKPQPPEWWSDFADEWYCRPLIYADVVPIAPAGQAEPVFWWDGDLSDLDDCVRKEQSAYHTIPLYTHPRNGEQGGEWIRCDERLPTEADGKMVWTHDNVRRTTELVSWAWVVGLWNYEKISHWKPTGLTRPQPLKPKEGES